MQVSPLAAAMQSAGMRTRTGNSNNSKVMNTNHPPRVRLAAKSSNNLDNNAYAVESVLWQGHDSSHIRQDMSQNDREGILSLNSTYNIFSILSSSTGCNPSTAQSVNNLSYSINNNIDDLAISGHPSLARQSQPIHQSQPFHHPDRNCHQISLQPAQ